MNLALNPFDKGKRPENIEELAAGSAAVGKAIKLYLDVCNKIKESRRYRKDIDEILEDADVEVISLEELRSLASILHGEYAGEFLNLYVVKLAVEGQKSFVFDNVKNLTHFLEGMDGLEFVINGNFGDYSGAGCRDCKFKINGDPGRSSGDDCSNCSYEVNSVGDYFAEKSHRCTYKINGSAGSNLGWKAYNSFFYVAGDVGKYCGSQSVSCGFEIKGNADWGPGQQADGSIFIIEGQVKGGLGSQSRETIVHVNKRIVRKMLKEMRGRL